jgi:hypothetical protein
MNEDLNAAGIKNGNGSALKITLYLFFSIW